VVLSPFSQLSKKVARIFAEPREMIFGNVAMAVDQKFKSIEVDGFPRPSIADFQW
jgi:hypothetical protein